MATDLDISSHVRRVLNGMEGGGGGGSIRSMTHTHYSELNASASGCMYNILIMKGIFGRGEEEDEEVKIHPH